MVAGFGVTQARILGVQHCIARMAHRGVSCLRAAPARNLFRPVKVELLGRISMRLHVMRVLLILRVLILGLAMVLVVLVGWVHRGGAGWLGWHRLRLVLLVLLLLISPLLLNVTEVLAERALVLGCGGRRLGSQFELIELLAGPLTLGAKVFKLIMLLLLVVMVLLALLLFILALGFGEQLHDHAPAVHCGRVAEGGRGDALAVRLAGQGQVACARECLMLVRSPLMVAGRRLLLGQVDHGSVVRVVLLVVLLAALLGVQYLLYKLINAVGFRGGSLRRACSVGWNEVRESDDNH